MRVCVLVLGDVGRSPRMCFHSLSLAQHDCQVDLVGYHDSELPDQLNHHPNVRKINLRCPPRVLSHLPSLIGFALKFIWLFWSVLWTLFWKCRCADVILMQNPPAVPTLAAVILLCKCYKVKLVLDWHNYSYSVLRAQMEAARLPKVVNLNDHLIIRLCRKFEWHFGAQANVALCVSRAMRADIERNCGSLPVVLYDRPPHWKFKAPDTEQLHSFVHRMATKQFMCPFVFRGSSGNKTDSPSSKNEIESTSLSYRLVNEPSRVLWRQTRPAVVVSSTSWTVDEDFSLPPLIVVITGKGPEKDMYLRLIAELDLRFVNIVTPWLETDDYPLMLQIADFGVCLHTSTSGLDLPMKVVDMFGCGLPVLAKHYGCVDELLIQDLNGHTFEDSKQLAMHMCRLLQGYPNYSKELIGLRQKLRDRPLSHWEDNWDATVWPLLQQITNQSLAVNND